MAMHISSNHDPILEVALQQMLLSLREQFMQERVPASIRLFGSNYDFLTTKQLPMDLIHDIDLFVVGDQPMHFYHLLEKTISSFQDQYPSLEIEQSYFQGPIKLQAEMGKQKLLFHIHLETLSSLAKMPSYVKHGIHKF